MFFITEHSANYNIREPFLALSLYNIMEVDWKEKNTLVNSFKRDFPFLRLIIKLDTKRVFTHYGNDAILSQKD